MKHTRREELLSKACPIETKDASAGLAPELKALLDKFTSVAGEVKAANDERINGLAKKFDDVVTQEKAAKIVADLEGLRDDFNKKFAELSRAPKDGGDVKDLDTKMDSLRMIDARAFEGYVRKGDIEGMQKAQRASAADEYKALREAIEAKFGLEGKDLSTIVAEDGGFLILPQYEKEMEEILLETSPMRQVANVSSIGSRELIVPVNRKGTQVAWIGETGTRAATNTPDISQAKFTAHEIYAYPLVTLAMLEDAQFDVEGWLNDEVTEALMIEENAKFVLGDGNGKPLGFLSSTITFTADASYDANTNWGQVAYVATGASGAFAPSYPGASPSTAAQNGADKLFELMYALKPRFRANATWMMTRRTMGAVRTLKTGDGHYVIRDAITESGLVPMLLGNPVLEAEDMPEIAANTYSIALGDWDKAYQIVDRVGVQVRRDEVTQPGYVKFHFRKRTGGGPRNWDAYKVMKFGTS